MALVFLVFGVALMVLNPPIAQPLGVIVASTFVALGVFSTVSAFLALFISNQTQHRKARFAFRLLRPAIWAGAAVAIVATVVGLVWP